MAWFFPPVLVTALVCLNFAQGATQIPHYDLEMTGAEWEEILSRSMTPMAASPLDPILEAGKRNLDWLRFINEQRTQKISLSDKSTMKGIPIDSPKEYNESTILADFQKVTSQLPPSMKKVIIDGAPLTASPGVPDEEYIQWGRKVDGSYQLAARWISLKPYLPALEARRSQDVRGYYFLRQEPDLEAKLKDFQVQPAETKARFKEWLFSLCLNSNTSAKNCEVAFHRSEKAGTLHSFYKTYLPAGERTWNSFFNIPKRGRLSVVSWPSTSPDMMVVPFKDPGTQEYRDYLKINLEDEWKWFSWMLRVDFNNVPGAIVVHWVPGVVPHVPGLGSNEIYMDANAPLTEWDVQWTIRHEFGHNLGLPDCYLEFYDPKKAAIVSYQHDVENLMCSRKGKLQQIHFDELKRAYFPSL